MPCHIDSHEHNWPTEGELIIEKCEHFCGYCDGPARDHEWKFPWFLRRHVRTVHVTRGDYPDVDVSDGWTDKPNGMPKTPNTPNTQDGDVKTNVQSPVPSARTARTTTGKSSRRRSAKTSIGSRSSSIVKSSSRRNRATTTPARYRAPTAQMVATGASRDMGSESDNDSDDVDMADDSDAELPSISRVNGLQQSPEDSVIMAGEGDPKQLKSAFQEAVCDLIAQGVQGGLSRIEIALAMVDEADRITIELGGGIDPF